MSRMTSTVDSNGCHPEPAAAGEGPAFCSLVLTPGPYIPPLPSSTPIPYVTAPSTAPTTVISMPDDHQERTVIRLLAAPTAKCAISEITAAAITARTPCIKKKGMTGMMAQTAVDRALEKADTSGFESASSE